MELAPSLAIVMDKIHSGIVFTDLEGHLYFLNRTARNILGLTAGHFLPKRFFHWYQTDPLAIDRLLFTPSEYIYEIIDYAPSIQLHTYFYHFEDDYLLINFWKAEQNSTANSLPSPPLVNTSIPDISHFQTLWQVFPHTLVLIDQQYQQLENNQGITQSCCYHLFDHQQPCKECPLKPGLSYYPNIGHQHNSEYFTESIIPIPNSKRYILLIENTSKKVATLQTIKQQTKHLQQQKDKLEEKNQHIKTQASLIAQLFDINRYMHTNTNIQNVIKHFISTLQDQINASAILLFVNDYQSQIWLTETLSVDPLVTEFIKKKYQEQLTQHHFNKVFPLAELPWPKTQIKQFILKEKQQQNGFLIIITEDNQHDLLLSLYSDSLAAYLHSCNLTRTIAKMANIDSLTELYNRDYFIRKVKKLTAQKKPFSIILADANGLKKINDNYGHYHGDAYIKKIAYCLKESIQTDYPDARVCRIGGDEYSIILPDISYQQCDTIILQIKTYNTQQQLTIDDTLTIPVSLSLGAASYPEQQEVKELLKQADNLMYADKKAYYQEQEKMPNGQE